MSCVRWSICKDGFRLQRTFHAGARQEVSGNTPARSRSEGSRVASRSGTRGVWAGSPQSIGVRTSTVISGPELCRALSAINERAVVILRILAPTTRPTNPRPKETIMHSRDGFQGIGEESLGLRDREDYGRVRCTPPRLSNVLARIQFGE